MQSTDDWDFAKLNTKSFTHCFHLYPAMMIPQIPRRLIQEFLDQTDKIILDPYCGSGTTLVEANLSGRSAIGVDLNPLALMIAEAKVTPISIDVLESKIKDFCKISINDDDSQEQNYWFSPEVLSSLQAIKSYIDTIDNTNIRRFFLVAFSETIRDVSYVNKGGYKRHRMKNINQFHPDAHKFMYNKLQRNIKGLQDFIIAIKDRKVDNEFFNINTVHTNEQLQNKHIDAIITSPPYGDSRTTVAYGEFSSFSLEWLGYKTQGLDRLLMGGSRKNLLVQVDEFPRYLDEIIQKVGDKNSKRADDIKAFYIEYQRSISNVSALLNSGKIAVYVVGNRIVKDQKLPMDRITTYFFEQNGYQHVKTITRSIPNKRMPRANSPSNLPGTPISTMNEEHIVVMRKPCLSG